MRLLAAVTFVVVVIALIAQALSLALLPSTTAGTPAVLSRHAHYGSLEPGSEPYPAISSATTLRVFLRHGVKMALAALAPGFTAPRRAGRPMSRAAWRASPYYRAGLHFSNWSEAVSAWEARHYDAGLDRRFDAAWHPLAARWGYWMGRLLFLWVAVTMLGILSIVGAVKQIHVASS